MLLPALSLTTTGVSGNQIQVDQVRIHHRVCIKPCLLSKMRSKSLQYCCITVVVVARVRQSTNHTVLIWILQTAVHQMTQTEFQRPV